MRVDVHVTECDGGSGCFAVQDAPAARVQDDEVFHEDRRPLGLAGHALPCAHNAALEVLGDGDAARYVRGTGCRNAIDDAPSLLLSESGGSVAGGHRGWV